MGSGADFHSDFHVCIVGGGVVGLAGGILFRRHGFKVTVLERDVTLHTTGAGIQLHPNAVRVLQDIGVYEKIKAKSIVPPAIILKEYATGQVLHDQDLLEPAKKYGAPMLTLHRADLRQVLYDEAVAQGVDIRHGININIDGIDLKGGTLKLLSTSGPPENFHADLYIGADGSQSVVREALVGEKQRAIPHGKIVHRMLVDEGSIMKSQRLKYLIETSNIVVWLGPECELVTYGLHGTFNIAFTWPYSLDPKDMFFGGQQVDLDEFRSQLGAWDPEVRELLDLATSCSRWQFFEPLVDDEGTPWIDDAGKFCIVGDAAHRGLPYLGQGAAAGVESVSMLAYLIGKTENPEQVRDCLSIYQRSRKERTGHVIRATLKTGRLWQMADGPLKEARDHEFLNEVPCAGYPNLLADPFFQEWLWGYDAPEAATNAWAAYKRDLERKEAGS